MALTASERERLDDFDAAYRAARLPVMRRIERRLCGCDYGATSWATREEADLTADLLGLRPGMRLLDIGAGAGWPALYLAKRSGCDATLADLPLEGLRLAVERAAEEGLSEACRVVAADAAALPFGGESFDAINHSDVLCCLIPKREALAECRRVIRPGGRMAFSVIYVAEGLSREEHAFAVETAPDFVETEVGYPELMAATGWEMRDRRDLTTAFRDASVARMRLEREEEEALATLRSEAETSRRRARFDRRIEALDRGHLRRELFLAVPAR